ncbi:MAG TPA: DUF6036 family nucleotidyltransferase [Ignavibacteria bacterium]|nr:DUF6036 family nucleotidyltransferase [Ignavibacteria bacterium]
MKEKNLFTLLEELAKSNVKFVVCGGIACVLHGVNRVTLDIDILADMDEVNLKKIIDIAHSYGLKPRIPEPVENFLDESKRNKWVEEKNALVYTFFSDDGKIQLDVFLKYPINYKDAFKKADKIEYRNLDLYVTSIEDLLFAKKNVLPPRHKDLQDIEELEKIYKSRYGKEKKD